MKITAITCCTFRLPLRLDFRWASLQRTLGQFVLVEIHTDDGRIGLGEAIPLPDWGGDHGRPGGETPGTVRDVILGVLGPALAGTDPMAIEAAHAIMDRVLRGHSYARCAIDIALHDIVGQVAGLPLYRLLGGAMRDRVAVAHMIGILPAEQAVEEAHHACGDGAIALQIKGGQDAARDLEVVAGIRDAVGDAVFLRLDANQGYGRAKQAARVLDAMRGRLDMVEQPVADRAEMAALTRATPIDVIADESVWDARDAMAVAAERAADALSIYLAKAGGIAPARRVAAVAMAAGLPCDVNGSLESGIGNAANLHFALSSPPITLPCVIPMSAPAGHFTSAVAGRYFADDVIAEPLPARDGHLLPPERPGLGVVLDRGRLEKYRDG
jgi:muconate cycloisomerase